MSGERDKIEGFEVVWVIANVAWIGWLCPLIGDFRPFIGLVQLT
jgi:hypothetical protein